MAKQCYSVKTLCNSVVKNKNSSYFYLNLLILEQDYKIFHIF